MESNYNIALNKGWDDLALKNPIDIVNIVKVDYLKEKQQFIVPFFQENYIVDCTTRTIIKESDRSIPELHDRILILHYLTFFEHEIYLTNKWVSLKEIPNGGALFYPAFHKDAIVGLIKNFGYNTKLFLECAKKLKGTVSVFGDVGAVIEVFPMISLCAAVWEGEDDIPPNATILYDPSIEYLLHIESVISLGICLAHKLIDLA